MKRRIPGEAAVTARSIVSGSRGYQCCIKHVVRNRFVVQNLEDMSKSRHHLEKHLDTESNIHVNYSSY